MAPARARRGHAYVIVDETVAGDIAPRLDRFEWDLIGDGWRAVLAPAAYDRWLGNEPDPRDLLQPFPSELMAIWPISTRPWPIPPSKHRPS